MLRRFALAVLIALLPFSAADGQVADTIFHKTPLFTTKDLAIAAGFGVATTYSAARTMQVQLRFSF